MKIASTAALTLISLGCGAAAIRSLTPPTARLSRPFVVPPAAFQMQLRCSYGLPACHTRMAGRGGSRTENIGGKNTFRRRLKPDTITATEP